MPSVWQATSKRQASSDDILDNFLLVFVFSITYDTEMDNIILDTNVLLAALRSRKGASYKLLTLVRAKKFRLHLSVPLFVEYESVCKREQHALDAETVDDILNYLALVASKHDIFYLWRPILKDPKDDHVLELAVKSSSQFIVTFNKKDFIGAEPFGVSIVSPLEYLQHLGEIK